MGIGVAGIFVLRVYRGSFSFGREKQKRLIDGDYAIVSGLAHGVLYLEDLKRKHKKRLCGMTMYYPLPHISYSQIKMNCSKSSKKKKRETVYENPSLPLSLLPFPASSASPVLVKCLRFPETP